MLVPSEAGQWRSRSGNRKLSSSDLTQILLLLFQDEDAGVKCSTLRTLLCEGDAGGSFHNPREDVYNQSEVLQQTGSFKESRRNQTLNLKVKSVLKTKIELM